MYDDFERNVHFRIRDELAREQAVQRAWRVEQVDARLRVLAIMEIVLGAFVAGALLGASGWSWPLALLWLATSALSLSAASVEWHEVRLNQAAAVVFALSSTALSLALARWLWLADGNELLAALAPTGVPAPLALAGLALLTLLSLAWHWRMVSAFLPLRAR